MTEETLLHHVGDFSIECFCINKITDKQKIRIGEKFLGCLADLLVAGILDTEKYSKLYDPLSYTLKWNSPTAFF